jgi:Fe2+ or Zn2+ uptake regulation protein
MKVNFAKEGFVQSIAFDEKNMLYGIAGSDSHLYFFKKGKIKFEQFPPVKTPCI